MKKTGEMLRKAREEKGLSLHEIGLSLKISSKVLRAIEDGNEQNLPAKTFLRGFVQSYANFLHLDVDKVLESFYEEMGSTRPKPYIRPSDDGKIDASAINTGETEKAVAATAAPTPIKKTTPPPTNKADGLQSLQENKTNRTILITVLSAVLVGLIFFTKKMIDKYSKEAEVPSSEVAQTMEGATPVSEADSTQAPEPVEPLTSAPPATTAPVTIPSATPIPKTESTHPMTTAATPSPTPIATATATPVASVTPTPTPKLSPSPTPSATPSPTPVATATPAASATPAATVAASPTPTPTPKPTPKEESGKPVELIVEALDTVEIEYSSPTGKTQKIKLSAEQVHTFKSKSGLKISFSNGGAVNLILNGKELGIPGDLGKSIKLSY